VGAIQGLDAQKERLTLPGQRSQDGGIYISIVYAAYYIGELQYVKKSLLIND
jgi:hypothetical protein